MSVSLTVLASALPGEAAALLRRVESPRPLPLARPILSDTGEGRGSGPCRKVALGRLAGTPVAVVVTGPGEAAARAGLEWMLRRYPASRLIFLGAASGLVSGLEPEDLVVSRRVERADRPGGAGCSAPPGPVHLALRATGGVAGVVVSPPRFVLNPEEKRMLGERWGRRGARPVPAVADREAAAFAEVARAAGLPWVSLHAVSDALEESWPDLLEDRVCPGAGSERGELLRSVLRQPAAIPGLLRARRRLLACSEVLAEATRRLLRGWEEREGEGAWTPSIGRPARARRSGRCAPRSPERSVGPGP